MDKDPLLGTMVSTYEIQAPLGRGGMGAVYRAHDTLQDRTVAVKVMLPELSGNDEFRERFIRESRTTIDHPNVVEIFEAGQVDDLLYIVMRLVDGPDLKTLIVREQRLLPARAIGLLAQASSALDVAHENGVVHRDIKPQNILIETSDSGDERAFVSDFGLVKKVSADSSFTASTYLLGSLQYMSPEQIEGRPIDGRSDVYSLACVAFECLTGELPFAQESEVSVLYAHMNQDPPRISNRLPVLPQALDDVISKGMAKDPDERFLTASEFVSALGMEVGVSSRRLRSVWGVAQMSASTRRKRPVIRQVAMQEPGDVASVAAVSTTRGFMMGIAASLVLLLAWAGVTSSAGRQRLQNFVGSVADALPFVETAPDEPDKDGKDPRTGLTDALVPAGADEGSTALNPGEEEPAPVPVVVPDGGGHSQERQDPPTPVEVAGDAIVFGSTRTKPCNAVDGCDWGIFVMDPDGSDSESFYNNPVLADDSDPEWAPDGQSLVYTSGWSLYEIRSDGTRERRISPTTGWFTNATWSPDGDQIAFAYNPTQDAKASYADWEIGVINDDGTGFRLLTNNSLMDSFPSWSPDGKSLLFASGTAPGTLDIFSMDVEGRHVHPFVSSSADELMPAWSPDGKRIAFVRETPSGYHLFVKSGAGAAKRMSLQAFAFFPDWSPDGKRIAFSGADELGFIRYKGPPSSRNIFVIDLASRSVTKLTDDDAYDTSPDWR